MIDTPDRRLTRASLELVSREAAQKSTQVTVVLPRRGYAPLLGRLLHDRTADKIAAVISQVPNAAATIIPFDVESRVHLLHARHAARLAAQARRTPAQRGRGQAGGEPAGNGSRAGDGVTARTRSPSRAWPRRPAPGARRYRPLTAARRAGVTAISELNGARKATIEGRVRSVEIRPVENSCVFDATIADEHRDADRQVLRPDAASPGSSRGARSGSTARCPCASGGPAMINPAYELLPRGE